MKHVGDITKLDGSTLEPVDCVCGGSPCQDLSVAGKRAGLAGERSGLFMEQIRIIKEMRQHDIDNGADPRNARPRFMVWENVPGAFSSNHGEDFQAVLSEIIKVADPDAPDVPLPPKGKWPMADAWYGDGWSVAYRVHDAQFWGVPQRRKRIALVADFGGLAAPEVLFEREGVSGNPEPGTEAREETAGNAGEGPPCAGTERAAGIDIAHTLTRRCDGSPQPDIQSGANIVVQDQVFCLQGNGIDRADTAGCNGAGWRERERYTLNTIDRPAVVYSFKAGQGAKARDIGFEEEVSPTLLGGEGGNQKPAVVYEGANITSPINRSDPQPGDPCHALNTDSRNYVVTEERERGPHDEDA